MGTNKGARTSKFIALVLRHDPAAAGITLDPQGWAVVEDLLRGVNITRDELDEIVRTDNKGRYSYSDDGTKIRANQGHSVKVDLGFTPIQPPAVLYHGTASRFLDSINRDGLTPQTRQHVHLSAAFDTAVDVGRRHGRPVVLIIDAEKMYNEGVEFYRSENGVWLTNAVPAKYIKETRDG